MRRFYLAVFNGIIYVIYKVGDLSPYRFAENCKPHTIPKSHILLTVFS